MFICHILPHGLTKFSGRLNPPVEKQFHNLYLNLNLANNLLFTFDPVGNSKSSADITVNVVTSVADLKHGHPLDGPSSVSSLKNNKNIKYTINLNRHTDTLKNPIKNFQEKLFNSTSKRVSNINICIVSSFCLIADL